MEKQINSTIKAHLIRSAFYVLLLVAVCVIPFALAQRKTAKQSLAKPGVAQNGAKQAVTQRAMTAGPVAPPRVIAPLSSGAAPSRGHVIDWSNYPTFPNSSIRKLSEAPPRAYQPPRRRRLHWLQLHPGHGYVRAGRDRHWQSL